MKRLPTGIILFDSVDIICISLSAGSMIFYFYKTYKTYKTYKKNRKHRKHRKCLIKRQDPIINELKKKSPILSKTGKRLDLPLIRGGDDRIRGYSLMLKNKRLAKILRAIIYAKQSQKKLKLLQNFLIIINGLLTSTTGFRIASSGSLNYVQIILFAFPSTLGGFLLGALSDSPLAIALLPVVVLLGRGVEDVSDPYENCRAICKVAEEFHNKQMMLEMKNLKSLLEETSDALGLPLDQVPLVCTEDKLSLLERFKLRELIRSDKARRQVQYFSEFIKKFPECDADPEAVLERLMETGK